MRRAGRLGPIVLLFLFFVPCAGAWTWPVRGPVLETFSFDPAHPYAAGQHRGIAIGADAGTSVVAPAAGVVSFAGTVPTNGLTLTIQTADGLAVSLTHLGSTGVERNVHVAEGAVVGTVGPSGTAEFAVPYVHLGIRTASNDQGYLDPLAFLPAVTAPAPVTEPAPPSPTVAPTAPAAAAPTPAPAAAAPAPAPAAQLAAPSGQADAAPAAAPAAPARPATTGGSTQAQPGQPVERSAGLVLASPRSRLAPAAPVVSHAPRVLEPFPVRARVATPIAHEPARGLNARAHRAVPVSSRAAGPATVLRDGHRLVRQARPAASRSAAPPARSAGDRHHGIAIVLVAPLVLAGAVTVRFLGAW